MWKDWFTTNRIIIALLTMAVLMQANIMYRQRRPPTPQRDTVLQAPEGATVDLTGLPIAGSSNTEIVLIEFSDYECPYCRRHANGVKKELWDKFVATGKIRYGFANNPLPNHANASFLATAAICAGEQHRYWEMHDRIFETQATSRAQVSSFVDGLAIDLNKFNSCLDGYTSNNARIEMDIETARRLGFKGTPAFALGRATSDGGVRVQTLLLGALSFAEFDAAINNLLESKN